MINHGAEVNFTFYKLFKISLFKLIFVFRYTTKIDVESMDEALMRQELESLELNSNEELNLDYEMLNHVVLPRHLPQTKRTDLFEIEMNFLLRFADMIEDQEEWIPSLTVNMFIDLKCLIYADFSPDIIFELINELKPGGTFAMFLNGQNCMFIIYMPFTEDNKQPDASTTVIVATFPASLGGKYIYRTFGGLEVKC